MAKTVSMVVLILLLISSIQVIGSESLYVETDAFSEDLSEYFDNSDFVSLNGDEKEDGFLDLDISSIPADYDGGHFYVDENGKYVGTIDLDDINSAEVSSGDVVMTGISSGTGEPGTDDAGGDDSYNPDDPDGRDNPDGVIGLSMDFIDFPPMTKNDTCGLSETEIMKEYEVESEIDPGVFHIYNPFAFKSFKISHPESYPDTVDVRYKIEVKYTGEEDVELGGQGKGWLNVTPNNGELLHNPTSHWWESDAEPNEETITVRADITEITPGRHTAYIVIYSYYYYTDRTIDNTEEVDYTHVDAIPLSLNVWSDPAVDSSLRYSILGGESAYKYDLGPIRIVNAKSLPSYEYNTDLPADILNEINGSNGTGMYNYTEIFPEVETADDPSSIILEVWNNGSEDTNLFYTVEPDLMISNDTDHFLYSEVIHDFHRIINSKNLFSIEPYQVQTGRNNLPLRLHVSEGEHDYIRIRLDVYSFIEGMKYYIDLNKDTWDVIHPDISLSDFKKDVLNPKFAIKITSSSGDSFWFEISSSGQASNGLDVKIAELEQYSPNVVPQGETLNFMNVIAYNPCPLEYILGFDTTIYYKFGGVLAHADLDDINNPPPIDSWVEGDHVSILPKYGVAEYGGSPGGDNLQNKKGRNLHSFYVDTTSLEPGTYVYYPLWLAECEYWTGITKAKCQQTFGPEGCQGMGLAPAISPAKCVFTVKPANWTPEESVEIQDFNPLTMVLDNLNTSRIQNIGEIFEYTGTNDIIYEYGPEFSELNTKEFKIEKHGECTVIYGEELPNVQVVDDSMMFDIYPKKPFDTSPLPADKVIIVPRKDYVEGKLEPKSDDPDSSFEERGGTSYDPPAPDVANPFNKYDQQAYINGQMTHIDPPPLYSNIKTQVLNPVTGEWIDIQDPLRRNPEIGDWVGLLEDAPVGSNLTFRVELYIRDLSEYASYGLNLPSNGNSMVGGMGNLEWPLTVNSFLPDNLEYEQDSAKVRLGAWWNKKGSIGECGCNCFLQNTKVAMSDGSYKNIEDICVGDLVKSYDEETNTIKKGEVTQIIHHDQNKMTDYYLIINNDLKVTPDHPFYMNGEWIFSGELKPGDILGFQDNTYEIRSIEKVFKRIPTFNLEIETCHNYMVKSNDCNVLVHNSYHPETEGDLFFSWAEKFTDFEPGLSSKNDNAQLTWNLPSGTLIQSGADTTYSSPPWFLFGQPIEHFKGVCPLAPYHPTLNIGARTTGTVAIEIIFNVTVTQDLDEDTIVTSDLFVDNFYNHYYSNHEGKLWLNTDDAHITTRNYNHPPSIEIFSPYDGETNVSVKTDTFRVMVTDPDNDPVSVSFYWTDKPRFEIDVYTGTMTSLVNVEEFESSSGDYLYGVPSPVNSDYELCTHGNRMETIYNVDSGKFVEIDPRPVEYKFSVVDIKIVERTNPFYYTYDSEGNVTGTIQHTLYDSDGNLIPRTIYFNKPIYELTPLVKYLEFEDNNPEYEWYVEVSDIASTTRSEINSFTTHKSPRIDFTYDPEEPQANENIIFNLSNIYDPDNLLLEHYIWGWKPLINRIRSEKDDNINNQHIGIANDNETDQYPSGLYAQYLSVNKYLLDGYAAVGNEETLEYSFNGTGRCDVNLKTAYYLYERPTEFGVYDLDTRLGITKSISATKTITISEGTDTDETNDPDDSAQDDDDAGGGIPQEDDIDEGDTGGGETTDDGNGGDSQNDDETQEESDTDEPAGCKIEIKKPSKNYLYLRNERKIPFFIPLVIGNIEVDATIIDQTGSISNIKFFFDGEEKEEFVFNPEETNYIYELNEKAFSWKELEVRAYNNEGNIVSSEKMDVLIFNL